MKSGEGIAEANVNQALAQKLLKLCKIEDLCNPDRRNEGLRNTGLKTQDGSKMMKAASPLFFLFF